MQGGTSNELGYRGRLDRPPRPADYIRFPDSFGRRFLIFVDTEEEFDWNGPFRREQRATSAMSALPEMHRRMRAAGAKPLYMVDHPIATDPQSVAILRPWLEAGECTIGTQLHPWVNPPFEEEVNPFNSFTGNLPLELQKAKLQVLTETIEEAFGVRPFVYRAGRYGVGEHSADLLREAGYRVDTSVRALFDYREKSGPDFSGMQPQPYWVGGGPLLEIPLSAAFTGSLRRHGGGLFAATRNLPRVRSLLSRTGLLSRIAVTPEEMPLPHVIQALDHLLAADTQLVTISFHSPSVEPGHTPYVRDEAELADFYRWWDGLFDYLARRGVAPATIEEVVEAAEASRGQRGCT